MKKNSFIKGALSVYISILFIKVLGCLYVIPFYSIIGETGGVLYNYAYQIYNLFLNISTAGIPVALSIILSEYNSLKMFKSKEKTYRLANKIMLVLSLVSFLVIFIFAGKIGEFYVSGIGETTTINNLKLVIRSVSFCLLVIPFLSSLRGYLQAHKYASCSSTSQIIEQVVRIAVVLLGSYLVIRVYEQNVVYGVCVALFGALFGGIFAYLYLFLKKKKIPKDEPNEEEKIESNSVIIKKILSFSIPMVLISIINDLYNIVDIKLIIIALTKIGFKANESEIIASIISTWAPKICIIITAIATGMIASIIPHLVDSYVNKNQKDVDKNISSVFKTMFIISIPTTIGITFLSNEIYYVFYGESIYGSKLLIFSALVNFIYCIYMVLNSLFQCMGKFKEIYKYALVGLLINACLDVPFVLILNKLGLSAFVGTSCASIVGFGISILLGLIRLKKISGYRFKIFNKYLLKIIISNIVLVLILIILKYLLPINLNAGYAVIVLYIAIYVAISAITYFIITYKFGLIDEVLGFDIIAKIKSKLKGVKR